MAFMQSLIASSEACADFAPTSMLARICVAAVAGMTGASDRREVERRKAQLIGHRLPPESMGSLCHARRVVQRFSSHADF